MECPEIYNEQSRDFILEQDGIYSGKEPITPVCTQLLGNGYYAVYTGNNNQPQLNMENYTYSAIPEGYSLLGREAWEASCMIQIINNPVLNLNGNGVIFGVVDTGLDLTSPAFRYIGGATRVLAYWDQTDKEGPEPDEFDYGREYRREEIDELLSQERFNELPRDEIGHGSYITAIAAATRQRGSNDYGAAHQCDIAVVKLKQAKKYLRDFYFVAEDVPFYQENDIMAGVYYLHMLALRENKPLVLCIGLGTNMGNHKGSSNLAKQLSWLGGQKQRMVICAAGNEALRRHHYRGILQQQGSKEVVEVNVGENVPGFYVQLWSDEPQLFHVDVIAPSGEVLVGVDSRDTGQVSKRFRIENTLVRQDNRLLATREGQQLVMTNFTEPIAGIWRLEITGDVVTTGVYHMWLPLEEQLQGEVIFIRSDPDYTVTEPGNAPVILTTGAYNTDNNTIYLQSGRGYSASEQIKPELCAPGVDVVEEYSNELRTGTSVAAACMSAAGILYMQWAVYNRGAESITGAFIKSVFIQGANTQPNRSYPNREWGYGQLCLARSIQGR